MTAESKRYEVSGLLKANGDLYVLWRGRLTSEEADKALTVAARAFQNGSHGYLNFYGTLVNVSEFAALSITEMNA